MEKVEPLLMLCYNNCSTCKKAKKFLEDNHVPFVTRDIKDMNPTVEELVCWIEKSGLESKKFFNTSGQLYRDEGISKKLKEKTLKEDEIIAILSSNGMLVKRPLLILPNAVLVGFKVDEWTDRLQSDGFSLSQFVVSLF